MTKKHEGLAQASIQHQTSNINSINYPFGETYMGDLLLSDFVRRA